MNLEDHPSFQPKPLFARNSRLIAIEGAIGVGKTSLVRLLASRWKASSYFEVFEENPFLTGGFYDNPKSMAFNTEVFFLLSRFRQHQELQDLKSLTLIDYFFEKNAIFSSLTLDTQDHDIYRSVYDRLLPKTRVPDLVVYLKCDPEILLRRIYFRDRKFERSLSSSYIERLVKQYQSFMSAYTVAPVLTIDTSEMDFVSNQKDLERIDHLIADQLSGLVQLSLYA